MMPFKADLQLAEWCLMRTDIDSKVKWQWMLVYIRLYNVRVRVEHVCVCGVWSGGCGEKLPSIPADQLTGQKWWACNTTGFPTLHSSRGQAVIFGCGWNVRSRKGKQKSCRETMQRLIIESNWEINYVFLLEPHM